LKLHRLGRLKDAFSCYQKALEIDPEHFDALHLSATVHNQLGDHTAALLLFDRAIQINQTSEVAYNNRGVVLKELKRFDEALASYDQALKIKAEYPSALNNQGVVFYELGRFDEALASYDQALMIKPDYVSAWNNRGTTLKSMDRLDEALSNYDQALLIEANYLSALKNRAVVLQELGRFEEALFGCEEVLKIEPNDTDALYNKGVTLQELKQFEEALAIYEHVLRIDASHASVLNNRGIVLQELDRFDDAIASYYQALLINPSYPSALNNLGIALQKLKRFDEALANFDQALLIRPDYPEALYNRGLLRLHLCQLQDGYVDHLHRWRSKRFSHTPLQLPIRPFRQGMSLQGRYLIWAEQGLGDEIFYAGLLPLFLSRYSKLDLVIDKRLHPIFKRSFPEIGLLDRAQPLGAFEADYYDAQAPIGDLGCLLAVDEASIRATREPYFKSNPERVQQIRALNPFAQPGLVCGIAWKSENQDIGNDKSIKLADLAPVLRIKGFHFVNLQYGSVQGEIDLIRDHLGIDIHNIEHIDLFEDIDGLLALIDACDVVITSSNVTAHLAGAIGKKAAVIVPYGKGRIWYWHHGQVSSLWYPKMKVIEAGPMNDWASSIDSCAEWLNNIYG
jgi:Tfp pilus assembly protein PilF